MGTIELIILIIAIIVSIIWFYGMRDSISEGRGVTNANANITFLLFLSVLLVIIFNISTFHLLWIFPLIFFIGMTFMVVPIFPFSLFNFGGSLMIRIAFIGLNLEEIKTNERRLKLLSEKIYKENEEKRNISKKSDESLEEKKNTNKSIDVLFDEVDNSWKKVISTPPLKFVKIF